MDYYSLHIKKVYSELHTSVTGLSTTEAAQRLEKYGKNELKKAKEISALKILLSQFNDFLIWILIGAAIVSLVVGEIADSVVIGIILVLNALFGFVQEYRAEKSIEALKKMSSLKAVVIRDGVKQHIDATLLVPGDVILLDAGDKVPADSYLIQMDNLHADEASLTGESLPVRKELKVVRTGTPIGDRKNMAYAGTIVTRGHGQALIVKTGMTTEIGKIAGMIQQAKTVMTPLQKKLEHFGKVLGLLTIVICVVVFITGVLRGHEVLEMFLAAISLAVAAVPEGLPAVVTITLALGVQKMAKKNVLIRKLPSVETLGATQVICSDKTGTLTHNQMTIKQLYVDGIEVGVTGEGYEPKGSFSKKPKDLSLLLKIGLLCNDASFEHKGNQLKVIGDPTEAALVTSAHKFGLHRTSIAEKRIKAIPFDSKRKLMTTIHSVKGKKIAYCKGAPDNIIKICDRIVINGKVKRLTAADKKTILKINEKFGKQALRVLGFAYKELDGKKNIENNLIFVGLQGMIDPARKEAIFAVKKCHEAGIKVIMITGDHKVTAQAIATKIGIPGDALSGIELDKMNEEELFQCIKHVGIFARVNPEHKMRIVESLQKHGFVVAMTGDGVNDAPSLKKADIGVAMGITGTDVAKEAADMILTDDNFASLVDAVEEGRTIFDNIQKFVEYLLSCNMGEVLVIFTAILIGLPLPLVAIQILWMNLVTDGLPALALGLDPEEPGVMQRPPREKGSRILDKKGVILMILTGIVMVIGVLGLFMFSLDKGGLIYAQTMAFTTLVMFQLWQVLNCRSLSKSLFSIGVFRNKLLWGAISLSAGLQLLVVYGLNDVFHTVGLSLLDWGFVLMVSSSVFVIREITKFVFDRRLEKAAAAKTL